MIPDEVVMHAEAVELELERFIERRAANADEFDPYRETRRRSEEHEAEVRAEWSLYHERLAEVHTRLADEHRTKAAQLQEPDG